MDQIVFQHDTVLSDVHMHQVAGRHLMTRLDAVGTPAVLIYPVFMSRFKILAERHDDGDPGKESAENITASGEEKKKEGREKCLEPALDEDGDLEIARRPRTTPRADSGRELICPVILHQSGPFLEQEEENLGDEDCSKDIIRIEHTMATPLEDVGKQVWRGALLLADFILSHLELFRGATALELGAGTGLASIVMATTAKTVYCTDVGDDLLSLCKRNVALNKHITEPSGGEVRVRQLDWLQHSLSTDAETEFSWTEDEIADLYDNTSFIFAADVCYDDDLTDGFFRTLYRLCSGISHTCTIFISIEKRMNFTLRHMDVSCESYIHFSHCLSQLQDLGGGGGSFRVEKIPCDFAQFLLYERIEQLELWKVTAAPLLSEQASGSEPLPS
ncbi:unnamed protein product [Menidia menidia]|uniref:(Atlantic silverside) hypothetical protein n=1 Tax=Menidia menidia TaxID=238744 RepID=A0A8S4AUD7_9TELE|nr:unnamed protein product [Menidia menidia]